MTRDFFFYAVQSELRFTRADVDILIRCSQRHYDAKCRSLSQIGGKYYGMLNQLCGIAADGSPMYKDAASNFTTQDLDITCKVLENANTPEEAALYLVFRDLFHQARTESEKLNAHCR